MKAVLDTNILIDYLNGMKAANRELSLYTEKIISVISWMEVLAGTGNSDEETIIRSFLGTFTLITVDKAIAEKALEIRKSLRLRTPDSIIYATARENGCILVTRNTKDFNPSWPDVREPYIV
ncbi:type II toxin-antitoxin system VapC family toxin [Patescibacteria group bacterium]|nr:type II toxin-antitoxin system VapC family toxin [Patescibacteria group bacterium]